jgi:hypothetical protein
MGYLFVKHESHGSVLLLIYSIEKFIEGVGG